MRKVRINTNTKIHSVLDPKDCVHLVGDIFDINRNNDKQSVSDSYRTMKERYTHICESQAKHSF